MAARETPAPGTPDPARPDPEAAQAASLRTHKRWALACLAVAAAAWGISHAGWIDPPWVGYLRAAAEAGMIGGLADWFAVTALFRRPLGLPIPHTNLIPANQERIAEGVARYLDTQFLDPAMLVDRLRRIDLARHLDRVLATPANRARIVDALGRLAVRVLESRGDAALRDALVAMARDGLAGADWRPVLSRLLEGLVTSDEMDLLIDEVARDLDDWLGREETRGWLIDVATRESAWYRGLIDRYGASLFIGRLRALLARLRDPESEAGRALRAALRRLPERVAGADALGARVAQTVAAVIGDPKLAGLADLVWTDLKSAMREDLSQPDSRIRAGLDRLIAALATQLDSPALREAINGAVEALVVESIPAWRVEIRAFAVEVLRRQSPAAFTRRIELQVGRDLQYIRINGTLLGALIGLVLHFVNTLAGT